VTATAPAGPAASVSAATTATGASECPAPWLAPPAVDAPIALPADGGHVVFHATASGTQNYACKAAAGDAGGAPAWSLMGPDAALTDCKGAPAGRHFATESGAPEWQLSADTYVIAHKLGAAAQSGTVPWLLLKADSHGPAAPLGQVGYVHRVRTTGGVAPAAGCDAAHLGAATKVPYTADYYFYAP
jgi:hypothetical protein